MAAIRESGIFRIGERGWKHGRRNRAERGVRTGAHLHEASNRLGRHRDERVSDPGLGHGRRQILRRGGVRQRRWRDGRRRSAPRRPKRDERWRGVCVHGALRWMGIGSARTYRAHRIRRRRERLLREIGVGQRGRKHDRSRSLRGRRQRERLRIRLRVHAAVRRVDDDGRPGQAQTVRRRSGRRVWNVGVGQRGRKHNRRGVDRGRRQRERLRIRLRLHAAVRWMDDDGRPDQAHANRWGHRRPIRQIGVGQRGRKHNRRGIDRGRRQREFLRLRLRVYHAGRRMDGHGRTGQTHIDRRGSGRRLRQLGVRACGRKRSRGWSARGRRQRGRCRLRLRVYHAGRRMGRNVHSRQTHRSRRGRRRWLWARRITERGREQGCGRSARRRRQRGKLGRSISVHHADRRMDYDIHGRTPALAALAGYRRLPGTVGIHWRRRGRSGIVRRIRRRRTSIRLPHLGRARAGRNDPEPKHDRGRLPGHGGRVRLLPRPGRPHADLFGHVEKSQRRNRSRIEHGRGDYHPYRAGRIENIGYCSEPRPTDRSAVLHCNGDRGSRARDGLERRWV